ncbi:hypothetical protein [Moorena sp. SIO4G3]|uniref:hypothetical protein n=1 Tax=Moorena sp. SIO4G3 TaxID=2607821 RepID=UPI0014294F4B|nr:hypothetical protein [Moorena sp. SIO4G3]NEO75245.1 hypothetical protein [Moorena sp. SIO4G3]
MAFRGSFGASLFRNGWEFAIANWYDFYPNYRFMLIGKSARKSCSLFPVPCSLLPVPYSLLPIPYSLLPIPYSLLPIRP